MSMHYMDAAGRLTNYAEDLFEATSRAWSAYRTRGNLLLLRKWSWIPMRGNLLLLTAWDVKSSTLAMTTTLSLLPMMSYDRRWKISNHK